ncbi:MAG: Flagellar hook-length control protein FliK [Pelotomaculum sp. PtaB.Bin104]|nr:MAG: Flagellar hook-length control protein FliK [Pelotomaculum sp. PtaB.Bin104]
MQIAAVNNVSVSRKGSGAFSEEPADAGGFDMAMAAVLALLNPQPSGINRSSAGSGGDNADTDTQIAGTNNGSFVDVPIAACDLPGNMLIVNPVPSQQDSQLVGGEIAGNSNTTGEMAQIPVPEVLPDATRMIAVTSLPEKLIDQSPDLTGQTTQAALSPEIEGKAQNSQVTAGDNAAKEQSSLTDNSIFATVAISETGNTSDSQEAPGKSSADRNIQLNNDLFVPASGTTSVADSLAEDETGQNLQVLSDVIDANTVNTGEAKNVIATQSDPANENNPASGSTAGEPQLASEKKIVTVVSENAVIKPDVENQSGVVATEQQRNPEFAYQGGNENKPPNNKLKVVQTVDESKNIISNDTVVAGKVDSGNGLGTGNTTDNSAQFPAQVSTDNLKGVPLSSLRDRVLQEIRHVYNNTGNGDRQTQVQLKLEPEQLGQLTIRLYFHKGELNAHFYTANNSVKEVLEGSLQQLRTSLGQQDLKLNEAFVFVGNGSQDNSSFYYQGRNQSGTIQFSSNNYRRDSDVPAEPSQTGRTETGPDSWQVNYLV